MFKLQALFLSYLFSSVFTQKTYFADYGTTGETCCPKRAALTDEKVNWDKNYILNGDFETPKISNGKDYQAFTKIPHWTTIEQFQILEGYHGEDFVSQYLELDHNKDGQAYRQQVTLYEGKF